MRISFKADNGDVLHELVENIYINKCTNSVVLHYEDGVDVARLMSISLKYKLSFYRYADDEHIGITVPMDSVFSIGY